MQRCEQPRPQELCRFADTEGRTAIVIEDIKHVDIAGPGRFVHAVLILVQE